jgi:hypothetical protein
MKVDLGVAQELVQSVKFVSFFVKDFFDPRIHQHLETMNAWRMGNINGGVFDAGAILRRLGDGVHFRVNGAKTVLLRLPVRSPGFINQAAGVGAMGHARWRAVVTGSENILIAHDDRTDFGPHTSRPFSDLLGYGHEILIPAQSFAHT